MMAWRVNHLRRSAIVAAVVAFAALPVGEASAYIGPGAGFAFLSSFLILLSSLLLAVFFLLTWPFRALLRWLRSRKSYRKAAVERLVIVGLDGLDPDLCEQLLAQGRLPHLARLRASGTFTKLQTTFPPISPVAWSSFSTGINPGRHNIYDFLTRDPRTYMLKLSSAEIAGPARHLSIGKYKIPLGKPRCTLLRKSQPFWKLLGQHGIFSTVLRVPITFPPEQFYGVQLSAMCVPDLRGTQGSFTWYTTKVESDAEHTGGTRILLQPDGNRIVSSLPGPRNPITKAGEELKAPFSLTLHDEFQTADLQIGDSTIRLRQGAYSDWVTISFKAGLGVKVSGIARFYLKSVSPHVSLYVSPINIDPERPAIPISHPLVYSIYLSKLLGKFSTLGLAEDTWALNERILDEDSFLSQCSLIHEERERMFFSALSKTRRGVCACVFDMTDRVQHMFYRFNDQDHPATAGLDVERYRRVIPEMYEQMDGLVGRVMQQLDERTVLMVMSDHGFKSFRKGVNLNAWLRREGYLALKPGVDGKAWPQDVDWSRTRAFSIGLNGLYLNLKGREAKGLVQPGEEATALKRELIQKLTGLPDEENGEVAIRELFDAQSIYSGPYRDNAPDLLVGYNAGYRVSWDSVIGKVHGPIFEENRKSWSGDHCIDPRLVPGVLFCNRPITAANPAIIDIAPTVLMLFGVDVPAYMDGKPLMACQSKT